MSECTAQEHADTVREALNFGYGGDPNYRPFYEDGITALDALLAEVERLTAERDAALHRAEGWVQHDTEAYAAQSMRALKRAEAAERERDEAREELASAHVALDDFGAPRDEPHFRHPYKLSGRIRWLRSRLVVDGNRRAGKLIDELQAAEALAERRRAGLQAIIDYVPEGFISPMDDEDSMNYRAIARAALQSDNTEEER